MSLFCGFLIANNSVPDAKVPPAVAIPVTVAPVNVEPGEYIIFSPLSKKWSITVNSPVPKFKDVAGLNFFSNIGIVLLCNAKFVLLDLDPLIASYCARDKDSVTVPYCKSSGIFNKSFSV